MMPFTLPSDWNWCSLIDVAAPIPNAIVDGPFGSNLKTSDYVQEGVPVLQGKNITNDAFRWFDIRYISDRKAAELDRSKTQIGDIIIVKIGSIGYSAILDDLKDHRFAIIPANLVKVTPNPDIIDTRYLHKWIISPAIKQHLNQIASKTAQPALSLGKIKQLPIPLPPLPEQRRIAAILDKAESLRALRRAALEKVEGMAGAIFLEMFGDPGRNPKGWPIRRIRDLLTSANYGTSSKAGATGDYPVLRMNNITRTGSMDLSDLKYMDLKSNELEKYLVHDGDILFNRTNSVDLVGKTAVFRESLPMAFAGYLIRLRVNPDNHPEYLSAFLNSSFAKSELRRMCKSIVGMANINAKEIQAMRIAQPPLKLQSLLWTWSSENIIDKAEKAVHHQHSEGDQV